MPTPAQIEEQIQLERTAIACGVAAFRKAEAKAEERSYASSTEYGRASIQQVQELIANALLVKFNDAIVLRKNGRFNVEIYTHLHKMNNVEDANALANIALKRMFDTIFSTKKDGKKLPNTVMNVCSAVGKAVEAECQIRWFEEQDPQLLLRIKNRFWLSTTGSDQKVYVAKKHMRDWGNYHWDQWPTEAVGTLGAWLVDTVCNETGWFKREQLGKGRNKYDILSPTDEYLRMKDEITGIAELYAPAQYPMLCEPNDWTNETCGGYYLNEVMRGNNLVRGQKCPIIQPRETLDFLNKLQKVEYRLNPFVVEVAKHFEEKGVMIGKFKPRSFAPNWVMPNKPIDIETNEDARRKYRHEMTDAMNARVKYLRSECVRTERTLELVKLFEGRTFYLPWSFDYRGRVYPIPTFLSVQDTDFGKSLLRFATESFMTPEAEEWLAFQVATTYGLDKKPISERIEWVNHHHELIARIATDPIGCLPEWEAADEPWQFLSACEEYYHCVITCDRQFTGLMIATDATCSGMQILAGLCQDKKTAELVNVTPGEQPADAYMAVHRQMIGKVPGHLVKYFDRSCVKRSVMTIPYNATLTSSKKYIEKALLDNIEKDLGSESQAKQFAKANKLGKSSMDLAKALREAMDVVAPGPLKAMDWIGKVMVSSIKDGNDFITWTAPSGFVVKQERNKHSSKQLRLAVLGAYKARVQGDVIGPDPSKHKSSGAPNLIHSLDASLLCITFNRFDAPFSVIHDSILCRATDMGSLSTLIRESYCEVFSGESFLLDFAQQIGAETEPPIIGDLHPENVLVSTYFFC